MSHSPYPGHPWRWLLLLLIAHSAAYIGVYAWHVLFADTPSGGDFLAFWTAARALLAGGVHAVYDTTELEAALSGHPYHQQVLSLPYSPSFLLFIAPLGYFSYAQSLAAWLAITGLIYLWAVFSSDEWKTLNKVVPELSWYVIFFLFVIASPFALYNTIAGQNGFIMGALLIAGLGLLSKKPVVAGICFGLLTVKPQLGIMVPVLLLAGQHWRCLAATVVTALLLPLAATLWLGIESWVLYANYLKIFTDALVYMPAGPMKLNASLYWALRSSGVEKYLSLAIQLVFLAFAYWSVWRACQKNVPPMLRNAMIVTATFIASPYIMTYDMTIAILPALFWIGHAVRGEQKSYERMALLLLLVTPTLALAWAGVPILFIAMLFAHGVLLYQSGVIKN